LVAVMGPVAASGGYYVCTPAKWISAQPGTITGSIGVLTGKVITADLLDKLLFRREAMTRGANARFRNTEEPFNYEERQIVRESIERVYDVFLDRVTSSRNMTRESAEAVSGGRVWTGSQALENGLLDELGGLEEGLAKARVLAGLDPRAPYREVQPERYNSQSPVSLTSGWVNAIFGQGSDNPASLLSYAFEGLELIASGKTLYLSEFMLVESPS